MPLRWQNRDCLFPLLNPHTSAKESVSKLNKFLNENRLRFENKKSTILEGHCKEVKLWKKYLGKANKTHSTVPDPIIKVETLEENQTTVEECSMCAIRIPNYIPEYFWGERINPACQKFRENDDMNADPFKSFLYGMPVSYYRHCSKSGFYFYT